MYKDGVLKFFFENGHMPVDQVHFLEVQFQNMSSLAARDVLCKMKFFVNFDW